MRINLLSRTLSIVILITIITFVRHSAALAQQTSDSVQAVLDAQRDVKDGVNIPLWIVVGLISAPSCTLCGIVTGLHIGMRPPSQSHDDEGMLLPVDKVITGACIGSKLVAQFHSSQYPRIS